MRKNYARDISAMLDDELERFVDAWMVQKKKLYVSTERFAGSGDLGRDVVGYHTDQRHEGPWDNFQCKQLIKPLSEAEAVNELGKILFHSSRGRFSLPTRYTFVAPRGVHRTVRELIAHPSRLKDRVLEQWGAWCAGRIVEKQHLPLDAAIQEKIDKFDFSKVDAFDAAKMLKDAQVKPVLVEWFGEDPGAAPHGVVPVEVQSEEVPFIGQLIGAYSERGGTLVKDVLEALAHADFGHHLRLQRTRYFDADSFKRYYRDNTPEEYVANFQDEMYHGVIDKHKENHPDILSRVDRVMSQAAMVQPSGVLAKYARVQVKQGICHHFVNEGRLRWKP